MSQRGCPSEGVMIRIVGPTFMPQALSRSAAGVAKIRPSSHVSKKHRVYALVDSRT